MCGVAALYAYHGAAAPLDRGELVRIRDHMQARGPDGAGAWFSDDGRVGLGHRRLAIIDLDERAAQPMHSADGRLSITFNGEIYNYRELRDELTRRGRGFRTESDTEVLLLAYEEWGSDMFDHLRGMYAFALWDGVRRRMLLARDPFGIKPLYYADDGWTVRIASQVKALLAGGGVSAAREPAGQVGFFLFGHVPEPFTCWQQVRALPAGCYLWVDALGAQQPQAHFRTESLFARDAGRDSRDATERVVEALIDSVRAHLVADVPVGAFLSGGIDSGAILGVMADLDPRPVTTVTLRFDEFRDSAVDEGPLAADTAHRYGARHVERLVSRAEFERELPTIMAAMDQPSIDGVNTWFAAKAAREQGLKVVMSGVGGDELFGGYDVFERVPAWVRRMWLPSRIPLLGGGVRRVAALLLARQTRLSPKAAGMLELGGRWSGAYLLRRGLFMPWELERLLPEDVVREGLRRLRWADRLEDLGVLRVSDDYSRVACLEAGAYMRNQLLRDTDWASMAHSVEVRTPLVDRHLWRSLGGLDALRRQGHGKRLLAAAPSRALPRAVIDRSKTGFMTPLQDWLDRARPVPQGGRLNLNTWARRFATSWLREPVGA